MLALRDVWSFVVSASLPAGTVIACVPQAIATVIEAPMLDASTESAVHYEDTLPLEIVSSPGTIASPVATMFQTDRTALRLVLPASWALRSTSAIAWMQSVNW